MRRPLLAGAAFFGAGCYLADREASVGEASAVLALAALLSGLALLSESLKATRWALAAAAFGLGVAAAEIEVLQLDAARLSGLLREDADARDDRPWRVAGTLRSDASERFGRLILPVDVERVERGGWSEAVSGHVRIEVAGETRRPSLLAGDRVLVWARLRAPATEDAVREGVAAFGTCKSARLVEILPPAPGISPRRFAARIREAGRVAIRRAMASGPERGLVLAMTLGDRSEIREPEAERFRASGTYHVLALSGAQVAIVAGLIVVALRWLVTPPWFQALVTTGAVAVYAAVVGGDVPVVRAVIMAAALLVGHALETAPEPENMLGLAALLLMIRHPATVEDVGFQLSFGATLGILVFVRPLTQGIRLPLRLELALGASLAAQASLAPVLAATFHRMSPAALLLNLAAVPLSTAVLLSGLAVIASAPLGSTVSEGVAWVAWLAARALQRSADLGPLTPWLDLRVGPPSIAVWLLHLCGLVWLGRGRRRLGLAAVLAAQVFTVSGPWRPQADGRLHLTMIDVGHGQSLLLRSPEGRLMLVDAGGSREARFDPGERRVAPEIWRAGRRRIDVFVATHAHPDHVAGFAFLGRAFSVGEVWEGPAVQGDPGWERFAGWAEGARAGRRSLAAGMGLDWQGARLEVLGPPPPGRPLRQVRNEDSLVLAVRFGEIRILLTADMGAESERGMEPGPAFVMTVPHHGSRSSSGQGLISAVRPRLALLSAGRAGGTTEEVLSRYSRAGALVLRTDRDGTIEVATDGRGVWVRSAAEGLARRIR